MNTALTAGVLVLVAATIAAAEWLVSRKRRAAEARYDELVDELTERLESHERLLRDCDESLLEILVWLGATEEGARMGDIREPVQETIRGLRRRIADTTGENR